MIASCLFSWQLSVRWRTVESDNSHFALLSGTWLRSENGRAFKPSGAQVRERLVGLTQRILLRRYLDAYFRRKTQEIHPVLAG